jgi:peptidoglycan hydrolase-like protein with peptidoglycan-binding domain
MSSRTTHPAPDERARMASGGHRVRARLPRVRRRGGRAFLAAVVVAGIAVAVSLILASDDGGKAPASNDTVPLGSAAVERRDLISREDVDGTLGFSDTTTIAASTAGTITRLRGEGDTVTRGRSLMSIDAEATAWVLYGTIPMYRDLGPGVSDGRDVRQLESNLKALGYDPGTVDNDWTSATTDAVEEFQDDRDLTEDGTITRSEVVISDGPARVGEHKAEVGDPVQAGKPVTGLTSTTPVVTAQLDAGLAADVHRGDRVRVTLPDGSEVGGRVTRVGTVATAAQEDAAPTVELRVALNTRRHGRLDGAPVSISLETGKTKDALSVPVTALVATAPGRYAVELAGSRRLVPVTLGSFADDWVEVSGSGIAPGTRVVVPR